MGIMEKKHDSEKQMNKVVISDEYRGKLWRILIITCLAALIVAIIIMGTSMQGNLKKTCAHVAVGFTDIMDSYHHSFRLFEKILQQEILHTADPVEIEAFLKAQDSQLLEIEGGDYDGVYMYYKGQYLYSWDTPPEVYVNSGYDATKRPWYLGAVEAGGEIFFSVPYPSYANDYMLATISRLQPDGETVIAYDIKLGAISKYVNELDLYEGGLTLICDAEGNVIGSTNHLYLGGNYKLRESEREEQIDIALQELEEATDENTREKAALKLESAKAQQRFFAKASQYLETMEDQERFLHCSLSEGMIGYAYANGEYTCFVLAPLVQFLPQLIVLWGALSFAILLALFLINVFIGRSNQVLRDSLTGLNNRRALIKNCKYHIQHTPDYNLGLIMLDLNDFKQINDQFGHVTGDHALQEVADALKRAGSEAPHRFFICRYGGDEFMFAGTDCTQDELDRTKELIVENLRWQNKSGGRPYLLEASIGIAIGKCRNVAEMDNMLEAVDEAMYQEKMRMKAEKKEE